MKHKSDKGVQNIENRWAFVTNLPQYDYRQIQVAERCPYPDCDGIKLPSGTIWRCSKGGYYHHFWIRTQILKELQRKAYATPLEEIKDPVARYFEHLRRNVDRKGIKEVPQQVLL